MPTETVGERRPEDAGKQQSCFGEANDVAQWIAATSLALWHLGGWVGASTLPTTVILYARPARVNDSTTAIAHRVGGFSDGPAIVPVGDCVPTMNEETSSFEAFESRRASLPTVFDARSTTCAKLWRRVFYYYKRHAGRVWYSHEMRPRVNEAIAASRSNISRFHDELARDFGVQWQEAFSQYESAPIVERFADSARYPEVLAYAQLFLMADRVIVTLVQMRQRGIATGNTKPTMIAISHALRAAAQVVSDTPGEVTRTATATKAAAA